MKNYYEILGIEKNANHKEIKEAYKNLAKEFHPDRNQGNEEAKLKFIEVRTAYQTLGDTNKRKQYDFQELQIIQDIWRFNNDKYFDPGKFYKN